MPKEEEPLEHMIDIELVVGGRWVQELFGGVGEVRRVDKTNGVSRERSDNDVENRVQMMWAK